MSGTSTSLSVSAEVLRLMLRTSTEQLLFLFPPIAFALKKTIGEVFVG